MASSLSRCLSPSLSLSLFSECVSLFVSLLYISQAERAGGHADIDRRRLRIKQAGRCELDRRLWVWQAAVNVADMAVN
jgi:hypothetical protein